MRAGRDSEFMDVYRREGWPSASVVPRSAIVRLRFLAQKHMIPDLTLGSAP